MRRTQLIATMVLGVVAVGQAAQRQPSESLFDGRSLAGWEGNRAVWRVVDGAIVGGSLAAPIAASDYLCSAVEYGDFDLRVTARIVGGQNAGVSFRSARVPGSHEVGGYQADMGSISAGTLAQMSTVSSANSTARVPLWGSLLDEFRPEPGRYSDPERPYRFLAVAARSTVEATLDVHGWNTVGIRAVGPTITLELNGTKTIDFTETGAVPRVGRVCVQVHSGPPSEAHYKDITIRRQ